MPLTKAKLRDLRTFQKDLNGVRLTATRSISMGAEPPVKMGDDLTRRARSWLNLPALLRHGDVKAEPPVDWRMLQMPQPPLPDDPAKAEPEASETLADTTTKPIYSVKVQKKHR